MQAGNILFFIAGRDKNGDLWKNKRRGMPPGPVEKPDVAQYNQQNDRLKNDKVKDQGMGEIISHAALNPWTGRSVVPARDGCAADGSSQRGASRPE